MDAMWRKHWLKRHMESHYACRNLGTIHMTTATMERTGRDGRVIGLIGLAHGLSHFYQLVLPPLFPLLVRDFNVSYTELGLVMTAFYVTSGLMQTAAGFLVDRFGARRILFFGLATYVVAIVGYALAPSVWVMLPVAVVAGIGNSVFHPADYSILTASVSAGRLGRAYGVHTFGGNLGWAAAPPFMLGLAELIGWRGALLAAAALGVTVIALLTADRGELHHAPSRRGAEAGKPAAAAAILLSAPVAMCFVYFMMLSIAQTSVQGFLPTTLGQLFGTSLGVGGLALTGFLLGAASGVIVGGFLADRTADHDRLVAAGVIGGALLLLLAGSLPLAAPVLIGTVALAGFATGVTTPSRDMLVRTAAPQGATGRIFGFVYSGLDAGAALAPVAVGLLLDGGRPQAVFWFLSGGLALAALAAASIKRAATARA
jgi:MFS family permease